MSRPVRSRTSVQGAAELLAGLLAPVLWAFLHYLMFGDPARGALQQIGHTLWGSPQNLALSIFLMACASVSLMVAVIHSDLWQNRARERQEAASYLEEELNRKRQDLDSQVNDLNRKMKKFHQTNALLQRSLDRREVMRLAADSLRDILGYDRVNVLMLSDQGDDLEFMASLGTGDEDITGVSLRLSPEAGVLYLAMKEHNQPLLVDDIRKMPEEYHLKHPWSGISQLRSRSFIICPIVVDGRAVGLFGVDNKHKKTVLGESDLDTVKIFAEQVAAAISKIDLLQAVELLTGEMQKTFTQSLKHREQMAKLVNDVKDDTRAATESVGQISHSSETLYHTVDETSSATAEMSAAIQQVSDNLVRLNELNHQAITSTDEIAAVAREVAEQADLSHQMAATAQQDARDGVDKVARAHQWLQEIADATGDTSRAFQALKEKTDNIEHFLTLIKEINQKTKLLSLNASIIAAQAGEHGRVFGVVAEEIHDLYEETSRSAYSIEDLVEDVRSLAANATHKLKQTRLLVREGVTFGRTTEQTLQQITASASRALEASAKISKASREQSVNAETSANSIREMGDIADMVARASQEQTGAISRIAGQVDGIEAMAANMTTATGQQEESISHIDGMMDRVRELTTQIFDEIAQRQDESINVISRLKQLKGEKTASKTGRGPIVLQSRQGSVTRELEKAGSDAKASLT